MGIWSKLFGAPPIATVADAKALRTADGPPEDIGPIIQPGTALWRAYPEDDISPESYRSIQRLADIGQVSRLMELYDAIANDYQVGSQLRTRKLAVAGAPVTFEGGDDSDLAKRIADDFALFWDKIRARRQLVVDILDDFYRGFSCVRPIWDSIDGKWQIVEHEAIESRYFYFEDAVTPLICPYPGGIEGVPIPDGYIYSECCDKAGPVVRAGIGRSVGKLWLAKGYALVDAQSYLEKFGSPHVQVNLSKTLHEGDPELGRIKDAARSFIVDQIGIMPAGATLAVIEAVNKAATVRDVYLAFMGFCDGGISKAIVGQVLTADPGPGGIGHGGAAEEQGEVRQDLREADAGRVEDVIACQIARPWTLYHYGPTAPSPRLCIDVKKPENKVETTMAQKQRAETLNILRASGVKISMAQVYVEFDLEEPESEEDTLPLPTPPAATDVGDPSGGVPAPAAAAPTPAK